MQVRWGVLGCASIAIEKVIPSFAHVADAEVVAIASRSQAKAAETATALGIPRAHGSYEALLADPDVDAVYIPLPNHLHAEWTIRAARAGKHVLCEKPLAPDRATAETMVAAAAEAGVLLMEAFMYRLHPTWVTAKRMVDDGEIGELRAIQSVFTFHGDDPTSIHNVAAYAGGSLYDIGCYPINVSRWFFDAEPDRILAQVARHPDWGVDVTVSAVLGFGDRQASFVCSTLIEDSQRVELLGSAGRIVIPIPFNIPLDRPTTITHFAGGNPPEEPGTRVIEFETRDQYAIEIEQFSAAVRAGGPVPIPPEDAYGTLDVITTILAGV